MTIGEQVKKARQGIGMSQYELAKLSGVSRVYIRMVEDGKANPSVHTLDKLSKALGGYLEVTFKPNLTAEIE